MRIRNARAFIVVLAICGIALFGEAFGQDLGKGTSTMANEPPSKVIDEENIEVDNWPFTIKTMQSADRYTVMAFLRNMPVSHAYVIDNRAFQTQRSSGTDPLESLKKLARQDLKDGQYRSWIIHWASQ